MLIKNIKKHDNLTLGKEYVVIEVTIKRKHSNFLILNDFCLRENGIVDYFSMQYYPSEFFMVVNNDIPKFWIRKFRRYNIINKIEVIGFDFLIDNEVFFARLIDGSEPEKSYFFYKLKELYEFHNLNAIKSGFKIIPRDHLENITWPKSVIEDWVDRINERLYKTNN